jgi:glutamine amidotransferase
VTPQVAIVDSGGANIASLRFALRRLGVDGTLTTDAAMIRRASHVLLPGVGAARPAMARLRATGLDQVLINLTQPVLGICLGLQLLFDASDEDDTPCLGLIPGRARRFTPAPDRPVPHMGWNQLTAPGAHDLLAGIEDGAWCYFVHSYAVDPTPATLATTDYGGPFTAVTARDNFCGTQFHPERSGAVGARLLGNFLALH